MQSDTAIQSMRTARAFRVCSLFLLLLCCCASWGASDANEQAGRPLHGVVAVALTVDRLDDNLAPYGIDRSGLIAAASERLNRAGIEVIDSGEWAQRTDAAQLSLQVRLIRAPYYFYLYGVRLIARGKLALVHGPNAYATAEIWSEGSVGAVQPSDLGPLRELALRLIDQFIAEHRLQNG
ncbi:MAG: hypothetical protein HYY48_12540 [Gammaproteobacteria bacterium]|nr:hypothetical protein [Gammaproteobacteria bacterium]